MLESIKMYWQESTSKMKWTVVGLLLVLVLSVLLTVSNLSGFWVSGSEKQEEPAIEVTKGSGLIAEGTPLLLEPSEEQRLLANLLDIVSNTSVKWNSTEEPLCQLVFTRNSFTVYNGDIKTDASFEFYGISVTDNGRSAIWRVFYEDGSHIDATLHFQQDTATGTYTLWSEALPSFTTYTAQAPSSQSLLEGGTEGEEQA